MNKWMRYEKLKARFIATHPFASVSFIQQACKEIARRLGL